VRYLLDTNILSERARPRPHPAVVTWMDAQSQIDLAIGVLSLGEIGKGIERLATGPRRDRLREWLEIDLPRRFRERVLSVDERVAREWGRLSVEGERAGRPLPVIDGLLLATAAVHDLTFVTRNQRDCAGRGVPTLDPWAVE
jgi:predicted nucleic acid-binding protein